MVRPLHEQITEVGPRDVLRGERSFILAAQ